MPSTVKTGESALPRLPHNRTCYGHAKIDANDPKQTLLEPWNLIQLFGQREPESRGHVRPSDFAARA
jgi:hypothetical protein